MNIAGIKTKFEEENFIELLAYYEGELQAREFIYDLIKTKSPKTPNQSTSNYDAQQFEDPLSALLRDSNFSEGSSSKEISQYHQDCTGESLSYSSDKFDQINNLIKIQKYCEKKMKKTLFMLEKHHSKVVDELTLRKGDFTKLNDSKLEDKSTRECIDAGQEAQIDSKDHQIAELENKLEMCRQDLASEKDRQKYMILYLMEERKQLLGQLHEMKLCQNPANQSEDSRMIQDLSKRINLLSDEREKLAKIVNSLRIDNDTLQRRLLSFENDFMYHRQNNNGPMSLNREVSNQQFKIPQSASFPNTPPHNNVSYNHPKNTNMFNNPANLPPRSSASNTNNATTHSTVLLRRPMNRSHPSRNIIASSKCNTNSIVRPILGTAPFDTNSNAPRTVPIVITKRSTSLPRNPAHQVQFNAPIYFRYPGNEMEPTPITNSRGKAEQLGVSSAGIAREPTHLNQHNTRTT